MEPAPLVVMRRRVPLHTDREREVHARRTPVPMPAMLAPLSRGPIESWLKMPAERGTRWSPGGDPDDVKETRSLRGSELHPPLHAVENRNLRRTFHAPPVVKAEKIGNVTRLRRVPVL